MAKNNKKRRSRKILLALLMLLLTFVTLSTSTYAWFTANKTVTVSTINVNVAASNGLQISVDGLEWKSVITNEDIIKTIGAETTYTSTANTNQLPSLATSLAPVSTVGTIDTNGMMEMFLGEVGSDAAGNYQLTATKSTETRTTEDGDFVVFDLFFQVQEETTIYLTNNSKVAAGGVQPGGGNTGIQNAARVGFIVEGTTAAGSAKDTIQSLKTNSGTAIIWEPNTDVHTEAAVAHALSTYNVTTTVANADQLPYNGIKAEIPGGSPQALNSTNATYFSAVTPTLATTAAGISADNYLQAFTIGVGITKVRVYMWVEGQDVDCENMASGGQVAFDLQFSSNKNQSAT